MHDSIASYPAIDCAYAQVVETVLSEGVRTESRDGGTIEVIGVAFQLENIDNTLLINPARKLSPTYACAELLWYLSGNDSIDMIRKYAPQYERFANEGVAHGAYGKRWLGSRLFDAAISELQQQLFQSGVTRATTQPGAIVELLHRKPASRQAVMSMWNDSDLLHAIAGDKGDLPCTLTMQFLLRGEIPALHCVVNMRSNDVWLGLPYDVWCFTCVQRLVADCLGVSTGTYTHFVGSMHIYDRDVEHLEDIHHGYIESPILDEHNWATPSAPVSQHVERMVNAEAQSRGGTEVASRETDHGTMLGDCVAVCSTKWNAKKRPVWPIRSPQLRELLEC